jgi:hypothetical protein
LLGIIRLTENNTVTRGYVLRTNSSRKLLNAVASKSFAAPSSPRPRLQLCPWFTPPPLCNFQSKYFFVTPPPLLRHREAHSPTSTSWIMMCISRCWTERKRTGTICGGFGSGRGTFASRVPLNGKGWMIVTGMPTNAVLFILSTTLRQQRPI